MRKDFRIVTEISGESVSARQVGRFVQRYYWAGEFCTNKDVLEVACGAGQGLGYLASVAATVHGGDITPALTLKAHSHYGSRMGLAVMDAEWLPFSSNAFDVVILFEAIYYLSSPQRFLAECQRVLRPKGILLLATANCDLVDFNPSPLVVRYYGVTALASMLSAYGFDTQFFGGYSLNSSRRRDHILRLAKRIAVKLRLIPKSMQGKRWLKRLVFGKLVTMPAELGAKSGCYEAPSLISARAPDIEHEVLYCAATLS